MYVHSYFFLGLLARPTFIHVLVLTPIFILSNINSIMFSHLCLYMHPIIPNSFHLLPSNMHLILLLIICQSHMPCHAHIYVFTMIFSFCIHMLTGICSPNMLLCTDFPLGSSMLILSENLLFMSFTYILFYSSFILILIFFDLFYPYAPHERFFSREFLRHRVNMTSQMAYDVMEKV